MIARFFCRLQEVRYDRSPHSGPKWRAFLKRTHNIQSTNKGRREETQPVKAFLRDNDYPMSFIWNCERVLTKQPAEDNLNGFVVLPFVQGLSEKIGRILKQRKVKVAYKPQKNDQQPFSASQTARRFWPPEIRHSIQNQLHTVQFCVLWPNRKIITDPNCGAQKGSDKCWPELQSCKPCPPIQP